MISILDDIKRGIRNKYPICCIIHYIIDYHILRNSPYEHRMTMYNISEYNWVPCIIHTEYILKIKRNKPLKRITIEDMLKC